MVGKLIESRFFPGETFDVSIGINVIRPLIMTIVLDPTLITVFSRAPFHKRSLSDPGIVIILCHTAVVGIVRGIQRFGIAF